jgi:hypothetical protein
MSDDELKVLLFALKTIIVNIEGNRERKDRMIRYYAGEEYKISDQLKRVVAIAKRLAGRIEARLPPKPEPEEMEGDI